MEFSHRGPDLLTDVLRRTKKFQKQHTPRVEHMIIINSMWPGHIYLNHEF